MSRAYLTFKQGLDETQINRELLTKLMSLSEIIKVGWRVIHQHLFMFWGCIQLLQGYNCGL